MTPPINDSGRAMSFNIFQSVPQEIELPHFEARERIIEVPMMLIEETYVAWTPKKLGRVTMWSSFPSFYQQKAIPKDFTRQWFGTGCSQSLD